MVKLESKEDRGYVVQMARDDYESGHPVEDFKEFAKILHDDGIEATDSLWNIYLDNCCDESSQLTEDTQFKYIYRSNIEDPYDDYEKDLLGYDGQKCRIKKNLGNGNYEVEFEDGSEFDVMDDELEDIDFHGDNNGHDIEEGLVLKEAASSGYKVFTLAIDVAFPEGKTPRDYGVDSSVPGAQLFKELSKALGTLGLEMAGDYVSQEADVTDVYKDNEYEFFDEGLIKESISEREISMVLQDARDTSEEFGITDEFTSEYYIGNAASAFGYGIDKLYMFLPDHITEDDKEYKDAVRGWKENEQIFESKSIEEGLVLKGDSPEFKARV